MKNIFLSVNR